jgi:hypothetical protein
MSELTSGDPPRTVFEMSRMSGDWSAHGDSWTLLWRNAAPHLSGTDTVRRSVIRWLGESDGVVAVTPTGPFVRADVGEPLAVLSALFVLRWRGLGDFTFSGDPPEIPALPPGAVG